MSEFEPVNVPSDVARENLSLSLRCIGRVSQKQIAEEIGVSDATVSRFVSDDLPRACRVLAAAGLKVVPVEAATYDPAKVQLLLELARDHLKQLETVEQLQWD